MGGSNPAGLDLDNAYNQIVNVPSTELGTMDRIDPFNENLSYIWHKINNTHIAQGGVGQPCPRRTAA